MRFCDERALRYELSSLKLSCGVHPVLPETLVVLYVQASLVGL